MEKKMCDNCVFFKEVKHMEGHCRRFPPTVFNDEHESEHYISIFPEVLGESWCGEWQTIEEDE